MVLKHCIATAAFTFVTKSTIGSAVAQSVPKRPLPPTVQCCRLAAATTAAAADSRAIMYSSFASSLPQLLALQQALQ